MERKTAKGPAKINGKERDLRKIRYTMPIVRSRRPNGERSARQMLISTATVKVILTMIKGTAKKGEMLDDDFGNVRSFQLVIAPNCYECITTTNYVHRPNDFA